MAARVCIVTRSANEVMVLATKAARGAGAPPAQAAQFGAAVVMHLTAGRDVAVLNAALAALPEGPIIELPLILARIAEGQNEGIASGKLDPAPDTLAKSYVSALPCAAALTFDGVVHIDLNHPAPRVAVQRIELPNTVYAAWSALAAKLLVPESSTSRLSGAGRASLIMISRTAPRDS